MLQAFLCRAVRVTGIKGKTESLFRREGTPWQQNFKVYLTKKIKYFKNTLDIYKSSASFYAGAEGKMGAEDSSDIQEEAEQNKEGSALESVNNSDTNTSRVQPSRCICYVVCIAIEVFGQKGILVL